MTLPGIPLRRYPNNSDDQNLITRLTADTLVVWEREVVGTVFGGPGYLRYIQTPDGYIYGGMIQPVGNQASTPIVEIPSGKEGFWAEVTVPYVDLAHDGVQASPWLRDLIAYNSRRAYIMGRWYGWTSIRSNNGFTEYRWNEGGQWEGLWLRRVRRSSMGGGWRRLSRADGRRCVAA